VDAVEGAAEVAGQWGGCRDGVVARLDFDGALAAAGADELPEVDATAIIDD
jgi:hypothetical protein